MTALPFILAFIAFAIWSWRKISAAYNRRRDMEQAAIAANHAMQIEHFERTRNEFVPWDRPTPETDNWPLD